MPYIPSVTKPRTLSLLVGAAGGSGLDLWVRGFAPFLERHLRQVQVQVVNRVGEGGLAVMRDLADAPATGAVLGFGYTPFLLARAVERRSVPLLDRLAFLGTVTKEPVALLAAPGTELAALRDGRIGKPLGLPPPVSTGAIAAAELAQSLPLEQLHFPSAAAARQATASGNLAACLVTLTDAAAALREGRLIALAIASARRHPQLPEVPTLTEEGMPVQAALRRGLVAPSGIGAEVAARLRAALASAATDPEFLAQSEQRLTLPRFEDSVAWAARNSQDLAMLQQRWETSPWDVTEG